MLVRYLDGRSHLPRIVCMHIHVKTVQKGRTYSYPARGELKFEPSFATSPLPQKNGIDQLSTRRVGKIRI